MGYPREQPSLEQVLAIAGRQQDFVTREQLLDLGVSAQGIKHRLRRRRMYWVARGVYSLKPPPLTQLATWLAAVLSCGPNAVLSHFSAAALWGIRASAGIPEISIPLPGTRTRPGVRVHRRRSLTARDCTNKQGIPVTRPVRTLIDIATRLEGRNLERVVNEADGLGLVDPEALRRALDDYPHQPGVVPLRRMLDRHTLVLTDTELERLFVPIAASAGLPPPGTQVWLNGFRVDFSWPDVGLVVETDGLRYHRTPAQQTRDRLRDQAHARAGMTPLRFTHAQVKYDPAHVRDILIAVVRRIRK